MPLYENVFIARQDISTAQVEALTETFATLVAENGGKVEKREYWGLRNLAYRIKKNRRPQYLLLDLAAILGDEGGESFGQGFDLGGRYVLTCDKDVS